MVSLIFLRKNNKSRATFIVDDKKQDSATKIKRRNTDVTKIIEVHTDHQKLVLLYSQLFCKVVLH